MKQAYEDLLSRMRDRFQKQQEAKERVRSILDKRHFERLNRYCDSGKLSPDLSAKIKELLKGRTESCFTRIQKKQHIRDKRYFGFLHAGIAKIKETAKVEKQRLVRALKQPSSFEDIWKVISRKYIPKAQRLFTSNRAAKLLNLKKIASVCSREGKKLDLKQQKAAKDASLRAKRATKEMLLFWKKNEKEEREARKRAEKEAAEQRRIEEEQRESRRQAKKLNFLLTQTELYSHFIAKKNLSTGIATTATSSGELHAGIDFADVDDQVLREEATKKAKQAVEAQRLHTKEFDLRSSNELDLQNPTGLEGEQVISQPAMLQCSLKSYQLKGLTWLAKLYAQGINGILADEMGLGKTVQAISLMAHLAETYGIWGPFLVIAPASTLHNWQQEFTKFVPSFRVIPYWGNVNDRKTLRKSFSYSRAEKLYGRGRDSPFHAMITSYQLIVTDQQHLNKIKWSFMVLDEAQAIKSSSSIRWKTLLGFDCRNRLLLTGTPIQNNMQELWALLHFIMPSLFDSHDEFSEWFSKDIENSVTQSTSAMGFCDEHQLKRLHLILKPFMLRRVKKDVESELGDKDELDIFVEMSPRQKRLYQGIKAKVPLQDLILTVVSGAGDSSLMNLVMQFRKVCNHPELIEKSETISPLVNLSGSDSTGGLSSCGRVFMGMQSNPVLCDSKVVAVKRLLGTKEETHMEIASRIVKKFKKSKGSSFIRKLFDADDGKREFIRGLLDRYYVRPELLIPLAPKVMFMKPTEYEKIYPSVESEAGKNRFANCINVPLMEQMIIDSAKMRALDTLLKELKVNGHRVLIYNQMTRMIDLMEDYLQYRGYSYIRLDGSCRIADRRDLVHDWQTRQDLLYFYYLHGQVAWGLILLPLTQLSFTTVIGTRRSTSKPWTELIGLAKLNKLRCTAC